MAKRNAWIREYEQLCFDATSLTEIRDLSIQYINRQREDLLSQVERSRTDAEQRHAEAERCTAEAERLRDVLKRLRTELEARASRIARTDHEDLRAIVSCGLRRANSDLDKAPSNLQEGLLTDSNSGNVMKRLRARVEQLERANKRLEKECDNLKLQKMVAQRELQRSGVPSTASSQVETRRIRKTPRQSPRQSLLDDSLVSASSPRSSPRMMSRNVSAAPNSADAASPRGSPQTNSRNAPAAPNSAEAGERGQLLAMVQHLEKEQAEHQQHADQVVSQLGHALRALEADNSALQEELKQSGQKASVAVEAKRKLERLVKQLRTEKEALTRQMMASRPAWHHPDTKASDQGKHPRTEASKSSPRTARNCRTSGEAFSRADNMLLDNTELRPASPAPVPSAVVHEVAAAASVASAREPPQDSSAEPRLDWLQSHGVAVVEGEIEVPPSHKDVTIAPIPQGWGLAWQPFDIDGATDDSPPAKVDAVAAVVAEEQSPNVSIDLSSSDAWLSMKAQLPHEASSRDTSVAFDASVVIDTSVVIAEGRSDQPREMVGPSFLEDGACLVLDDEQRTKSTESSGGLSYQPTERISLEDRGQPPTPAWASISVPPADMLPRVSSPRLLDTRARQGQSPPVSSKWLVGNAGASAPSLSQAGVSGNGNRAPRPSAGQPACNVYGSAR